MEDLFPYKYVGGGYFRRKGVPRGKKAETLHGEEAIEYVLKQLRAALEENESLKAKLHLAYGGVAQRQTTTPDSE